MIGLLSFSGWRRGRGGVVNSSPLGGIGGGGRGIPGILRLWGVLSGLWGVGHPLRGVRSSLLGVQGGGVRGGRICHRLGVGRGRGLVQSRLWVWLDPLLGGRMTGRGLLGHRGRVDVAGAIRSTLGGGGGGGCHDDGRGLGWGIPPAGSSSRSPVASSDVDASHAARNTAQTQEDHEDNHAYYNTSNT